MDKIPTVEELLQQEDCVLNDSYRTDYVTKQMIEFAKLHVEAALKEATKVLAVNTDADYVEQPSVDRILNSYSLDNIK